MSSNFSSAMFSAVAPQGTIEVVLQHIRVRSPEEVVLVMRHAGDSNPEYKNARRKLDVELKFYGDNVPEELFRDKLIPIFARHVVVGWRNVIGADGKLVPCVPDEVEAFLRAVAVDNPDKVNLAMRYAMPADHFRAAGEALGNG